MRRNFMAAGMAAMLLCMPASTAAAQTRPIETDEMLRQGLRGQIYFAWQQMKFEQLEAWAAAYRGKEMRSKDGNFWLPTFYSGFAENYGRKDAQFNENLSRAWNAVLQEWIKAYPNSPTPLLAHAAVLRRKAWLARGDGFAHTVWSEDWEAFKTTLEDLSAHLLRIRKIAETDPYWHARNADTHFLLDGNHDRLMENLKAGLARFPDYLSFYEIGGIYLSPKWGGSVNLYDAWVEEAVQRTRATEGTGMRVRIYLASGWGPHRGEDLRDPRAWKMLKASIADVVSRYPEASFIHRMASLACRAGDANEVRRLWREQAAQTDRPQDAQIDPWPFCVQSNSKAAQKQ